MTTNYRIYSARDAHSSYGVDQLAIALIDSGSAEELLGSIELYQRSMPRVPLFVITQDGRFDFPRLQELYRHISLIVFSGNIYIGEKANAVASVCNTNYFLLLRSDTVVVTFEYDRLLNLMSRSNHPVVASAILANAYREIVPCLRTPTPFEKILDPGSSFPSMDPDKPDHTLYPVMGLGFYDRALFQRLRGYDEQIHSEYFQLMDLGLRSYLFGYRITLSPDLLIQFPNRESIIEDRSERTGFERCYTKNLSIRRVKGKNKVRKPPVNYDRSSYREEVKERYQWLQKIDYDGLVSTWQR